MKRPIITAEAMQRLLERNSATVQVPQDAILTPAAQDLVRSRGISIGRTASQNTLTSRPLDAQCARQGAPRYNEGMPDTAPTFAEIRQAVVDKLPPELRTSPLVDELIKKTMHQYSAPACNHSDDTPVSSALGLASLATLPASGANNVHEKQDATRHNDPWRCTAGGVIRADSTRLPWTMFSASTPQHAINIMDVISSADKSPMGVGYMEWNASGFDWVLDYAEVNVVLEGELHITTNGTNIKALSGDVVFIPKGTALRFESPAYVKFVYITWPADWSGA